MRTTRAGYVILAVGLLAGLLLGLAVFVGLPAQLPWVHSPTATPGGPTATPAPAPVTGAPAPDFTLTSLAGPTVQLSSLKGQVVLVNFWATWCIPCRAEMPAIQQAYNAHQGQGFTVLAVNLNESRSDIQNYVAMLNVTFPVLLDAGDSISNLYRVRGYPTSFFIDRSGTVAVENVGMMTDTQLADNLAKVGLGE